MADIEQQRQRAAADQAGDDGRRAAMPRPSVVEAEHEAEQPEAREHEALCRSGGTSSSRMLGMKQRGESDAEQRRSAR